MYAATLSFLLFILLFLLLCSLHRKMRFEIMLLPKVAFGVLFNVFTLSRLFFRGWLQVISLSARK